MNSAITTAIRPPATEAVAPARPIAPADLAILRQLERKILWLSSWTIHHANHVRSSVDGVKVGGHQASSASCTTLMTALYLHALRAHDRVAVKPHASPVFHAIQYLLGRQSLENLKAFRGFGGAQAYPSRTKDQDDVDFSTGSVGFGGAMAVFAALAQDYIKLHDFPGVGEQNPDLGRMVAVLGDAELDEGNVFEALLESWKHDIRNVWWIIDYNRQSLDAVTTDRMFNRLDGLFSSMKWRVITLKYGKLLRAAQNGPAGEALLEWIDACPNQLYSALTFKGGAAWRENLTRDLGGTAGLKTLLDSHDDDTLHALMTNLAGHDLETVLEAYHTAAQTDDPTAFIAYTIKGFGLPLAGHKDNHAGLMTPDQVAQLQAEMEVPEGAEWDRFAGLASPKADLEGFLSRVPFVAQYPRRYQDDQIEVPRHLTVARAERGATQEAFGRILSNLARDQNKLAERIVTASPDVTVSTNLGGWVNRRQIFDRRRQADTFREEKVVSAQKWAMGPRGQHVELGIAENNLFLSLAAFGLSDRLFGTRLIPIGTLYDPFIGRGLDALNYACYQDARFMLVATPSGVTLAPEGGAHQSVTTPLIGMGQPGLTYFEPGYIDELAVIMEWGFHHMQAEDGGAVYLRLSTRPVDQPQREMSPQLSSDIVRGGYWEVAPTAGSRLAIVYSGAVATEAMAAFAAIQEDIPGAGLLAVPSADRLQSDWMTSQAAGWSATATDPEPAATCHVARLLDRLAPDATLVTVIDGHPATLSWLGAVRGHHVVPCGVRAFGQSGDVPSVYRHYGIDADAILDAAARACLADAARADGRRIGA